MKPGIIVLIVILTVAEGSPQPLAPSDSCDQAHHLLSLHAFNIFQAGSLCVHGI